MHMRLRFETLIACLLIALAAGLRMILIAQGWPLLDSDEGTMGLMALHIAQLKDFPAFFYGQGYMGATEAYLAALAFHFWGVSVFTLRLGLILIYVLFLIAFCLFLCQVYTRRFALVLLVLLAFGSNAMLVRELVAVGGVPETLLSGAVLLCLATWLALNSGEAVWRRRLVYAGWGFAAGFGFFSHMLVAPFVFVSVLVLWCFCRHELKGWPLAMMGLGLLIGGAPLIVYNIMSPQQSTLFYVLHAVSAGGTKPAFIEQLKGALLVSLPTATGAYPLCSVRDALALNGAGCVLVHAGWSLGIILLWSLSLWVAIRSLRPLWQQRKSGWSEQERRDVVRLVVHLGLLAAGAATLLLYIVSPNSALYPVATSRYLSGIVLTTPAVLWPLWAGLGWGKRQKFTWSVRQFKTEVTLRMHNLSMVLGRVLLLGVIVVFMLATWSIFTGVPAQPIVAGEDVYYTQVSTQHQDLPATQTLNQQEQSLLNYLRKTRNIHIYSDYWTCNRLTFQSQEQIICAVVSDTLETGHDRYLPYRESVHTDPQAAYVLHAGSIQDQRFQQLHETGFRRTVLAGYVIYERS
jgi:hypothetical protein